MESERGHWWAVVAAGLALYVMNQDGTNILVSLPALHQQLHLTHRLTVWLFLSGGIPSVALLMPGGRWADSVNQRGAFLVGMGGFAAATILAMAAPSLGWLMLARALQGGFSSLAAALVTAVAVTSVRDSQRGLALGFCSAMGPLGGVAGPAVAGYLITAFGWRSIFALDLPFMALAILIGALAIPAVGPLRPPSRELLVEALLLILSVGAIFLFIDDLSGRRPHLRLLLALAALPVAAMMLWRRLPHSGPVVELLTHKRMPMPLAALGLMAVGIGVLYFVTPFFQHSILHVRYRSVGFAIAEFGLAMAATSVLGGYLLDRVGGWPIALTGSALMAAGLLSMIGLDPAWQTNDVYLRVLPIGLGAGLLATAQVSAVMAIAPRALGATASAVQSMLRGLFFAVGSTLGALAMTRINPGLGGMQAGFGIALGTAAAGLLLALFARGLFARTDTRRRPAVHIHHPATTTTVVHPEPAPARLLS